MIKVSIIIPLYNKVDYINKCLDSLIYQKEKNIEIIIIDDGSIDGSSDICINYCKKYTNILYKKIKNSGVSVARNIGIELSRGKYILFLDPDDWLCNSYIKDLYDKIENLNGDLIIGGITEIIENKKIEHNVFTKIISNLEDLFILKPMLLHSCGNKLYLREKIKKTGIIFLERNHAYEDLNFNLKYILFSKKIIIYNKNGYFYYRNSNSLTKGKENLNFEKIYVQHLNGLQSMVDILRYKKLFSNEYNNFYCKKIKKLNLLINGLKDIQNAYLKEDKITKDTFEKKIKDIKKIGKVLYKNNIKYLIIREFFIKKIKNNKFFRRVVNEIYIIKIKKYFFK